ncbi:protein-glutamate methylesterase/protein-glutamine glutaminase [Halogranum rubrum]|uniref:Protein-glutamate methylesterase/protein-glutamine glutaminase n=1 Tax=Halogranum salarium B-1 TaxID=1210908 RepID=J3A4C6_9EURY|nr:chemotaxis response regulator protein-glutamate methylesterase [Halogranum salarium]EJN60303.1 protein-glutamate methylesterase [Halogranum salarium B-1]
MTTRSQRAVVVDDSRFMRELIGDVLRDGGVRVVAEAADGHEAVAAVERHRPDVVTMDVEMPRMNGIEAVERIMDSRPTPVLMLSAYTEDGADVTFDALDRGAVDFFAKPGGEVSMGVSRLKEQLVEKVRSVATADLSRQTNRRPITTTAQTARTGVRASRATSAPSPTTAYVDNPTLVIGSSTGGPSAVEAVLRNLPLDADFRVIVVQHMPDAFTGRFADRLDGRSEYDVREATDGARIGGGEALVANGGTNLLVSHYNSGRLRVSLTDDDFDKGVQPSVDVTMSSVAKKVDDPLVGVVLTGMGSDGAEGIQALHRAGAYTVAESEESSVIFGMPKRAIATGCIDAVHRLEDIAADVLDNVREEN